MMTETKSGKKCNCGHASGWHETLEGECSIAGCPCKKYEEATAEGEKARTHPDEIKCLACGHINVLHDGPKKDEESLPSCGSSGCDCDEFQPEEDVAAADVYYREHASLDPAVHEEENARKERAMARDRHHDPKGGEKDATIYDQKK